MEVEEDADVDVDVDIEEVEISDVAPEPIVELESLAANLDTTELALALEMESG